MTNALAVAGAAVRAANLAFELIGTGNLILTRIYEKQQERAAAGEPLTDADLAELMDQGDVQAALQKAQLTQALLAKEAS